MAEVAVRDSGMKDASAAAGTAPQRRRAYRAPPFLPLWALIGGAAVIALIGAYPYYGSNAYVLSLLGKFLCFAIFALSIDLIWGFTGILSLGHGVFFALGGYAMGMYMMRVMAGEGVYRSELPDFMVFLDWKELPWYWRGFDNFFFALFMALAAPALLAYVFGFFAFRSRIKGVYFSLITQALTYAFMLWFFRNDAGFGGNNGLTDFKRIYGYALSNPGTKLGLFVLSGLSFCLVYVLCRYLIQSKLGRVLRAMRDHESKLM
jgi:urea transport system permease protein